MSCRERDAFNLIDLTKHFALPSDDKTSSDKNGKKTKKNCHGEGGKISETFQSRMVSFVDILWSKVAKKKHPEIFHNLRIVADVFRL